MEHVFLNVFKVVLPVLICAGVGYWLAVTKAPFDNKVIGGIVSRVGYPTLIISHLTTTKIDVSVFMDMLAASALASPVLACLDLSRSARFGCPYVRS